MNSVECAIELQKRMALANAGLPADRTIALRMGVNLGDVIVEGGDIHGDGVNVAARLEGLAEPGSICVSGKVYDEVHGKIKMRFEDLGEVALKNLVKPVRVFRVSGDEARHHLGSATPRPTSKPSVAVLPFTNMNRDPKQQYFSDGMSEDIVTELSRYRDLFVIARNSSFRYRDKSVDVKRIGSDLGVRYVLDGSVRKGNSRVRVTVQLAEATTGGQVWADRYDRRLEEIFAVQDEVTKTIVATLAGRVGAISAESARHVPTPSWAAYDWFLQARECVHQYRADEAELLLARALELDPGLALALAWRALAHVQIFFSDGDPATLHKALEYARKAVLLDPNDAYSHGSLGLVYTFLRRFDLAGVHLEKATALNPNDVHIATFHAHWKSRIGRTRESLAEMELTTERDPFVPDWHWECYAISFLQEKRYKEAIQALNRMNNLNVWDHAYLACAYAHSGRIEEARIQAAELLRLKPDYSLQWVTVQEPFQKSADLHHLVEGLRKAGLPE